MVTIFILQQVFRLTVRLLLLLLLLLGAAARLGHGLGQRRLRLFLVLELLQLRFQLTHVLHPAGDHVLDIALLLSRDGRVGQLRLEQLHVGHLLVELSLQLASLLALLRRQLDKLWPLRCWWLLLLLLDVATAKRLEVGGATILAMLIMTSVVPQNFDKPIVQEGIGRATSSNRFLVIGIANESAFLPISEWFDL